MPIKDEQLIKLCAEQLDYYENGGTMAQKIDVQKRIEKRQKQLMKKKED